MKDAEQAKRLFLMAKKDVRALKEMVGNDAFSDEIFGFHAQQAVEKALKAWLGSLGKAYARTHDLGELMASVRDAGPSFPVEFQSLDDLVDFAVQYRYESFDDDLVLDRDETFLKVSGLVEHVAGEMKKSGS